MRRTRALVFSADIAIGVLASQYRGEIVFGDPAQVFAAARREAPALSLLTRPAGRFIACRRGVFCSLEARNEQVGL